MTNQYELRHDYDNGETSYYFNSTKPFGELWEIVNDWSDELSEELKALCEKLGINFEPWKEETLTLLNYEEPDFINID